MEPIEIILNCSYAYFQLSHQAQVQLGQMTPKAGSRVWPSKIRDQLPAQRFDPALIQIVRELGPEASEQGSSLKIFRLHPKLGHYASVRSKDGYERLCIDYEQAMFDFLKDILSEGGDEKIRDMIRAIELQRDWAYADTRQGQNVSDEIIIVADDDDEEWEFAEYSTESDDDESWKY